MRKILTLILLFATISVSAQSYPQIGMSKKELLDSNSNTDSLEDGTIFIKSSNEMMECYYFFNNNNICFCVVINFMSQNRFDNYLKFLKRDKYKSSRNKEYWRRDNFYIRIKDVGLQSPIVFIWKSNIEIPEDWDYHK